MSANGEDVDVRNEENDNSKEIEQSDEVKTQPETQTEEDSEVKVVDLSVVLTRELWSDDASAVEGALKDLVLDTGKHENTRKQALTMGALSTVLAVMKKWGEQKKFSRMP